MATQHQGKRVRFVDAESAVNARSPHALAGNEFLYEHVHLNFEGNYVVARSIAEQIDIASSQRGTPPWPTAEDCARRLGWNNFTRLAAERKVLERLSDAPFNAQVENQRQYQQLLQQIQSLQSAGLPGSLQAEAAQNKAAAEAHPDDWVLQQNLSRLQQQTGDVPGAVESLRCLLRLIPHNADAWHSFGLALAAVKSNDEAAVAFQTASRLRPELVSSLNSLAELHAAAGQTEQADKEFREVLRRKPYWGPAHLGLGKILEVTGHPEEANAEFAQAFKNRMRNPASYKTLGRLAIAKGWYDRAVENFTDSLRLFPADPDAHFHLGLAYAKLGRHAEAKDHYREVIRLRPDFTEAHFCLGLELGRAGDAAGAAAKFTEAVRLKPELVEARVNLGIALFNQHLNQSALEQFEEVLRRDPTHQVALKYMGTLRGQRPALEKR
jgi:tetratricopeptide (TPR) repeat protein